jgi:hypothetical protein
MRRVYTSSMLVCMATPAMVLAAYREGMVGCSDLMYA